MTLGTRQIVAVTAIGKLKSGALLSLFLKTGEGVLVWLKQKRVYIIFNQVYGRF